MAASFHYAFKIRDIASTRRFYVEVMGCTEGRSTETWIDVDFFGHQLSAHISDNLPALDNCGHVDGIQVPIPHFGALLSPKQFSDVQQRLAGAGVQFLIEPQVRYPGQVGEQWTMFFFDPSDNPIELKAFTNSKEVFAS